MARRCYLVRFRHSEVVEVDRGFDRRYHFLPAFAQVVPKKAEGDKCFPRLRDLHGGLGRQFDCSGDVRSAVTKRKLRKHECALVGACHSRLRCRCLYDLSIDCSS